VLELKDFHFSLWLVVTAMYVLYENEVSKYSQQSPPRWVIGTGQLCRLRFRPGLLPVGGGGGIMPLSIFVVSGRTCPFIWKSQQHPKIKGLSFFVVDGFTAMYVYMKE